MELYENEVRQLSSTYLLSNFLLKKLNNYFIKQIFFYLKSSRDPGLLI